MNVCFCRLRAQFLGISLNSAVLPIFLSVSIFTSGSAAYVSIYLQLHLFARNCFLVNAGVQQRLFSNNKGSPMSYCHTLKIVREERPSWLFLESQQSLFMWRRLPRKVFDGGSERAKDSQRRPFLHSPCLPVPYTTIATTIYCSIQWRNHEKENSFLVMLYLEIGWE